MKNILTNKKGVALLTVLVMVIGIIGLALSLHYFGRVRIADVVSRTQKMQSYYLAETGFSDAMWYFNGGGHRTFYADGTAVYQLLTPDYKDENRVVGEYSIYTSGVFLDKDGTFTGDDVRIFQSLTPPADTIHFLIWSGEFVGTNATATINDGTNPSVSVILNKDKDLNGDLVNESFSGQYLVPGSLSDSHEWSVSLTLSDGTNAYGVSDIIVQINGYGTPSATGLRKIKSIGYYPKKDAGAGYQIKTILTAEGVAKADPANINIKIKEIDQ